jgi:hypothetical protein
VPEGLVSLTMVAVTFGLAMGLACMAVKRSDSFMERVRPSAFERWVTALLTGSVIGVVYGTGGYAESLDGRLAFLAGLVTSAVVAAVYRPLARLLGPSGQPRHVTIRVRGRGGEIWRVLLRSALYGLVIGVELGVAVVALRRHGLERRGGAGSDRVAGW